jgi:hypothetical protein
VDLVSIILCICIGNMVAWLMAMYRESGQYNLLWNVMIGAVAAALWKLAADWAIPSLGIGALVFGGPAVALAAIAGFHAALRRYMAWHHGGA